MGEIKSTLDLVMERTRHLSLSDEEKAQQQRADFAKRLQGLLQQYEDGAMGADQLLKRISTMQNQLGTDDPHIVKDAVLGRIDPDRDNQRWMELISIYMPAVQNPLQAVLAAYDQKKEGFLHEGQQRQGEMLKRQYHIEGNAVIPNPQKEAHYLDRLADLRQETQTKIEGFAG